MPSLIFSENKKKKIKKSSAAVVISVLTFTTLWATSADDKSIVLLFSPEKRIWHFMQIVSTGANLHEV